MLSNSYRIIGVPMQLLGQWGHVPLDLAVYFFQVTVELHNVWQQFRVVISPDILQSVTAAAAV